MGFGRIHIRGIYCLRTISGKLPKKTSNNTQLKLGLWFQFSEIEPDLQSREGRIHFGGEHTMAPHGWIDTAMKSGARTAWEIHTGKCSRSKWTKL